MATVSSVLIESTTMSSSAQATDLRAPSMSVASFLVMTVTERFGTGGVYYCRTIAVPAWMAPDPALVAGPLPSLERLTLRGQAVDLERQLPVRVPHIADRLHDE